MKAVTIQNPWPGLFGNDQHNKQVEIRGRYFDVQEGEPFAIHCGGADPDPAVVQMLQGAGVAVPTMPEKTIVKIATLDYIETNRPAPEHPQRVWWDWAQQVMRYSHPKGYMLRDIIDLPEPVPCKGKQGFWEIADTVLTDVVRQWNLGVQRGRVKPPISSVPWLLSDRTRVIDLGGLELRIYRRDDEPLPVFTRRGELADLHGHHAPALGRAAAYIATRQGVRVGNGRYPSGSRRYLPASKGLYPWVYNQSSRGCVTRPCLAGWSDDLGEGAIAERRRKDKPEPVEYEINAFGLGLRLTANKVSADVGGGDLQQVLTYLVGGK